MQEHVSTSFIPKQSLQDERSQTVRRSPTSLLVAVSGIVLAFGVAVSAGLFFYEAYLKQNIAAQNDQLEKSRQAFEPNTIKALTSLDKRISSAKTLLTSHTALSNLFDELEERTLQTVSFRDFSYDGTDPADVKLTLSGTAVSYNAVAQQADSFSKGSVFKDPIFSEVNIGTQGLVGFGFSAVIDPQSVRYAPPELVALPEATAASSTEP